MPSAIASSSSPAAAPNSCISPFKFIQSRQRLRAFHIHSDPRRGFPSNRLDNPPERVVPDPFIGILPSCTLKALPVMSLDASFIFSYIFSGFNTSLILLTCSVYIPKLPAQYFINDCTIAVAPTGTQPCPLFL